MRRRGGRVNPKRILIATPVDGSPRTATISKLYHDSVRQLERAGTVILSADIFFADDLARARSRAVHVALTKQSDWDWILWIDDDVAFDSQIVPRMLAIAEANDYDMIGAPYPRKRIPAQFPYKPLSANQAVKNDCVEVDTLAFGFVLTARSMLETMCDAYSSEWFTDMHTGTPTEVIALFKQVHTQETKIANPDGSVMRYRELYSEDYSFCHRWRKIGGKIYMYVGEGSPLGHVGNHVFEGTKADLGNV